MPTWVIQLVEILAMHDGQDLADGYEPLSVDRFASDNDFYYTLHEGDITGVAQNNDDQGDDNNDGDSNNNEDPD